MEGFNITAVQLLGKCFSPDQKSELDERSLTFKENSLFQHNALYYQFHVAFHHSFHPT